MTGERFYEMPFTGARRSAPAATRNREPIAQVLEQWLPESGLVLEVASGTGEHAAYFAERFPKLEWQPSDLDPGALESIRAWRREAALANLREPVELDCSASNWPIDRADAVLNVNMAHISPWAASLGLIEGAARILDAGSPLILYGPWLSDSVETAPSNAAFDSDLKRRNPEWGLRKIEDLAAEAARRGFHFEEQRQMPANNFMLLFRKGTGAASH
ncbi:MAG TPA: DUF938 domain-containing protein [Sphingomicrobium sp.]|nr:DUF938 domain-containing protein [Sphingomicrobium sp.]